MVLYIYFGTRMHDTNIPNLSYKAHSAERNNMCLYVTNMKNNVDQGKRHTISYIKFLTLQFWQFENLRRKRWQRKG